MSFLVTVSDRVKDRKMANIAASLVAAATGANGSIDDKERELNEMITGLQILREELFRRVSAALYHITLVVTCIDIHQKLGHFFFSCILFICLSIRLRESAANDNDNDREQ